MPGPLYSLPLPANLKNGKKGRQRNGQESGNNPDGGSVKVPRDKAENRQLKEAGGFQEDDNEDIAYLNFALIWCVTGEYQTMLNLKAPQCNLSVFSVFLLVRLHLHGIHGAPLVRAVRTEPAAVHLRQNPWLLPCSNVL